jgi:ferritin-like metal-binding protein YciE
MPKMKSLEDLFVHLLKNIYYAEKQILKALPKMAEKAHSAQLRKAFLHHLKETEGQVDRLEQVFALCNRKPIGETCPASEGDPRRRREGHEKCRRSGCSGCQHDRRCPSH